MEKKITNEKSIYLNTAKALKLLRQASELLLEAESDALEDKNYPLAGSLAHYRDLVRDAIASDHGEAGLSALVEKL